MFIPKEPLTKENIFKRISSYDIFRTYCDNFVEVGAMFKSELREDSNPSCCISFIKGDLLYKDFGEDSYRSIDYVCRKYNITYPEALQKINEDFNLGLGGTATVSKKYDYKIPKIGGKPAFSEKKPTIIKIKTRKWNTADKNFWYKRYYITSKTLELFDVKPISHFWINDDMFIADECSYSYDFYWNSTKDIFYRKIYQPYSQKLKWVSNGGKAVQGEGVLPNKGNLLIITKSLKDVIVMYNLGFTAISPVSETSFLPSSYFLKQGKRFEKIILFFDSDDTGLKKAQEFSQKFNIDYKYIPLEYNIKDISDFIEKRGIEESKELLTNLFKYDK